MRRLHWRAPAHPSRPGTAHRGQRLCCFMRHLPSRPPHTRTGRGGRRMGVIHAGTIARASPGRGGWRAHGGRHRAESPAGEKKEKAAGFGRRGSKAGAADGAGAIEEKGERRPLPARRQVRKRRGTAARRLKSATATTMPTTSRRRTTARLRRHHRRDVDGQNHTSRVRRSRRTQWRASQARICGPRNMKGSRRQLLATWTHSHRQYRTLFARSFFFLHRLRDPSPGNRY
jgi:hypothetical protein